MILDLNEVNSKSTLCEPVASVSKDNSATPDRSQGKAQIIKKVIHTRVEMTIYPNGQTFIGKTQSWIEGMVYTPKPKKKKVAVKKTKKQKEEVY